MIYCAVDEAFDNNPLRRQVSEYDNNNKIKKEEITPPNSNNGPEGIIQYPNNFPSFFTAQGDFSSAGPYYGTTISELKERALELFYDYIMEGQKTLS